jgi:hypothetical protein
VVTVGTTICPDSPSDASGTGGALRAGVSIPVASTAALLCALALLVPRAVRADDGQAPRVIPAHVALELGTEGLVLGGSHAVVGNHGGPFGGGFGGLSAGLLFGVNPRWSVGLTGAFVLQSAESGGDPYLIVFGRVDAEARFHPVLGRWGDVWVSGVAGLGVFGDSPGPTFGPHVGVGAGADVHPLPSLSLGIHLRTGLYAAPDVAPVGVGAWGEASGAIVLGIHVP